MSDLQQALQKGVFELNDDSDRYKPNIIRISQIVSCPARLYYQHKLGIRPKMMGRMLAGIIFHEHLKDIVKNIPDFKEAEFEPECCYNFGKYKLVGHIDILTKDCVYEFKFSGTQMDKYGVPEHWLEQANAYATIKKRPKYRIVQVNSHDLSVTVKERQQDNDLFFELAKRCDNLYHCLEENRCPVGPLHDWQCWECECQEHCENFKKKQGEKNGV